MLNFFHSQLPQKILDGLYYAINEWKLVKSQISKIINSVTIFFSWSRSNKSWYCQCGNRYFRLLYFKQIKWKWKLVKSQIPKITNSVMISFSRSNDYKIESWLSQRSSKEIILLWFVSRSRSNKSLVMLSMWQSISKTCAFQTNQHSICLLSSQTKNNLFHPSWTVQKISLSKLIILEKYLSLTISI